MRSAISALSTDLVGRSGVWYMRTIAKRSLSSGRPCHSTHVGLPPGRDLKTALVSTPRTSRAGLWIGGVFTIVAGALTGLAISIYLDRDDAEPVVLAPADATTSREPPTCKTVIAHVMTLAQGLDAPTIAKLEATDVARCTNDKWPEHILQCLLAANAVPQLAECGRNLPNGQLAALELTARRDNPGGTAPIGSAAEPTPSPKLPASCREYRAALEKLSECRQLPAVSREGLKTAAGKLDKRWAELGPITVDDQRALAERCKQDMGSIKKSRALCAGAGSESPW